MARKSNKQGLILSILVIVFAAAVLCTLFLPVVGTVGKITGETISSYKGMDFISALFADGLSFDASAEVNTLYGMLAGDTAYITLFSWAYLVTCGACAVALVLAILSILGLKLKLINLIVGIIVAVASIAAFVLAILFAGELTVLTITGGISIGAYVFACGLIAGAVELVASRK